MVPISRVESPGAAWMRTVILGAVEPGQASRRLVIRTLP